MDDDRLNFYFAALEIARRSGLSPGAAQAELRRHCASGEVRSWKQPYSIVAGEPQDQGPPERIKPSEWKNLEIDLATDADGYNCFVDVSKIDLEQQIGKGQEPTQRDDEIIRQLRKGRQPGKNITWKAFCEIIRKACIAGCSDRGFSDETIENVTRKRIGQIG
jgi:hypothetical protein